MSDPSIATLTTCSNDKNQIWDIYFPQGFPSDKSYSIQNALSNKCIDVNQGNFVSQQLQLWDCTGGTNQLWLRPMADLLIQTSNGMCMDAYSRPYLGGPVYLSSCNDNLEFKWFYDGTYIQTYSNSSLCLSVSEGNTTNGAKLVVDLCSSATSRMQWKPFSYSQTQTTLPHIEAYSGILYNIFRCPTRTKVSSVAATYGSIFIVTLKITCSDGTKTTFGDITNAIASSSSNSGPCSGGYTKIAYNNMNNFVGDLNFYCSSDNSWKGWIMGSSGSVYEPVVCPQGQTIVGFNFWTGALIDGIDTVCDSPQSTMKPTARPVKTPTVRPVTLPTVKPTVKPTFRPVVEPTAKPSFRPTFLPSSKQTIKSTARPVAELTAKPSARPSFNPSRKHTTMTRPSDAPTTKPPSARPSSRLSNTPDIIHLSPLYGNITSDLFFGEDSCPEGSKVTRINGMAASWIYQLSATCDDKGNYVLGPWGFDEGYQDAVPLCAEGYKGWRITYGSFIGQISFSCDHSSPLALGKGLSSGAGNIDHMNLAHNQSVVGFQIYYDSFGIHAIRMKYAEFQPITGPCIDSMGRKKGQCLIKSERLAILWGFLTLSLVKIF